MKPIRLIMSKRKAFVTPVRMLLLDNSLFLRLGLILVVKLCQLQSVNFVDVWMRAFVTTTSIPQPGADWGMSLFYLNLFE